MAYTGETERLAQTGDTIDLAETVQTENLVLTADQQLSDNIRSLTGAQNLAERTLDLAMLGSAALLVLPENIKPVVGLGTMLAYFSHLSYFCKANSQQAVIESTLAQNTPTPAALPALLNQNKKAFDRLVTSSTIATLGSIATAAWYRATSMTSFPAMDKVLAINPAYLIGGAALSFVVSVGYSAWFHTINNDIEPYLLPEVKQP
jgi:hypothetical protein